MTDDAYVRALFAAHLHPDAEVRAARLADIEQREAERRAELQRQCDEAAAEVERWRAVCERLGARDTLQ